VPILIEKKSVKKFPEEKILAEIFLPSKLKAFFFESFFKPLCFVESNKAKLPRKL